MKLTPESLERSAMVLFYTSLALGFLGVIVGLGPAWRTGGVALTALAAAVWGMSEVWGGLKHDKIRFMWDDWEPHEPLFKGIIGLYIVLAGLSLWFSAFALQIAIA